VQSEQNVNIADLKAQAQIKQASGEAESTRLKASGEAEAIRATGNAKAETYRAGVEALGSQSYTAMQLMQIIGDRRVRLIPDVLVNGSGGGNNSLVDGLLTLLLWNQNGKPNGLVQPEVVAGEPVAAVASTNGYATPIESLPDAQIIE
jgi:uncharacterized membrane protein YqiK